MIEKKEYNYVVGNTAIDRFLQNEEIKRKKADERIKKSQEIRRKQDKLRKIRIEKNILFSVAVFFVLSFALIFIDTMNYKQQIKISEIQDSMDSLKALNEDLSLQLAKETNIDRIKDYAKDKMVEPGKASIVYNNLDKDYFNDVPKEKKDNFINNLIYDVKTFFSF